jgi:hypothetical protein
MYIYIYCIGENVLDRIITLEIDLQGLGNLKVFSQWIPHHDAAIVDLNYHKNPVKTIFTWS